MSTPRDPDFDWRIRIRGMTEDEVAEIIERAEAEVERLRQEAYEADVRSVELVAEERRVAGRAEAALEEALGLLAEYDEKGHKRVTLGWAQRVRAFLARGRDEGEGADACVCGEPWTPGVVHRQDGPCFRDETAP